MITETAQYKEKSMVLPPIEPQKQQTANTVPTLANIANKDQEGLAKHALKQIVKDMVSCGRSINTIKRTLLHYNYIKNIRTNEHEIQEKVLAVFLDVLKERGQDDNSLQDKILDYIEASSGEFQFRELCDMLDIGQNRPEKNKASAILGRLIKNDTIQRCGKKNGVFRKIDKDVNIIDFKNAVSKDVDMWMPFDLHNMVEIHPGNIILVAGEPNAGKTAFMFNIIRHNQEKWNITYFNSEMGDVEMKKRLQNFDDIPIQDWNFRAIERASDFADVIVPGEGNINIVDYLEIHDEFYKVGGLLADIHNKLDGAICFVCIQKNMGSDVGLGGMRTLEKPRLALAMKPGALKIVKAKNFKSRENPNGKVARFSLAAGCWLRQKGEWAMDVKADTKKGKGKP